MTLASRNKFVIEKVLESDLAKEDADFFQLRNEKELTQLQPDFLSLIAKLWSEQYSSVLATIDTLPELKIQKTEYLSRTEEQFQKYTLKTASILDIATSKGATYQEVINAKS